MRQRDACLACETRVSLPFFPFRRRSPGSAEFVLQARRDGEERKLEWVTFAREWGRDTNLTVVDLASGDRGDVNALRRFVSLLFSQSGLRRWIRCLPSLVLRLPPSSLGFFVLFRGCTSSTSFLHDADVTGLSFFRIDPELNYSSSAALLVLLAMHSKHTHRGMIIASLHVLVRVYFSFFFIFILFYFFFFCKKCFHKNVSMKKFCLEISVWKN